MMTLMHFHWCDEAVSTSFLTVKVNAAVMIRLKRLHWHDVAPSTSFVAVKAIVAIMFACGVQGWQPRVMWIGLGGCVFFTALEEAKKLYAAKPALSKTVSAT